MDGKQPMTFNEYVIVFAGQIYNIDILKAEILAHNLKLETSSDTEILLKSYICFGSKVVNKLSGIFSFAIWNKKSKTLFMARDTLGIMPFYYCKINDTFIFSTDIKAILSHPSILNNISIITLPSNEEKYFNKTIFKNIYELSPAYSMTYKNRNIKV